MINWKPSVIKIKRENAEDDQEKKVKQPPLKICSKRKSIDSSKSTEKEVVSSGFKAMPLVTQNPLNSNDALKMKKELS